MKKAIPIIMLGILMLLSIQTLLAQDTIPFTEGQEITYYVNKVKNTEDMVFSLGSISKGDKIVVKITSIVGTYVYANISVNGELRQFGYLLEWGEHYLLKDESSIALWKSMMEAEGYEVSGSGGDWTAEFKVESEALTIKSIYKFKNYILDYYYFYTEAMGYSAEYEISTSKPGPSMLWIGVGIVVAVVVILAVVMVLKKRSSTGA